MSQQVLLKRAYENAAKSDGFHVLVDRLRPRGIGKVKLQLDLWEKAVAPSREFRSGVTLSSRTLVTLLDERRHLIR